jgi:hypothetical protein
MEELRQLLSNLGSEARGAEMVAGNAEGSTKSWVLQKMDVDGLTVLEAELWSSANDVSELREKIWRRYGEVCADERFYSDKKGLNEIFMELAELSHRACVACDTIRDARKRVEDRLLALIRS